MKKYMTIDEYLKKEQIPKKSKNKLKLLSLLCLLIIIFSFFNIIKWCLDNFKTHLINKEIIKNTNLMINDNNTFLVNPPKDKNSNYYYYIKFPLVQTDFTDLLAKNSDTVAFLQVKNTAISYPVLKTIDNKYYLNHSFDKKKNSAGWIFMDYRNRFDNLSDNTIIYGHSRIDRTMFGTLRNVLLPEWQNNKDNYVISLSTLKENMLFQIFSIYTIKSESYYMTPEFGSDSEKEKWLLTMKRRNIAPFSTEVNTLDKILTLSTCLDTKGGRIVIHAKLIKKQNN